MSTIGVPVTTTRWPRSAMRAVVALFLALAVALSLAVAYGIRTNTVSHTVFVPSSSPPASSQLLNCRAPYHHC
ncbi:MAG TPA: hypothetical protein VFH45_12825 [Acidimicrobiales bacterium]|nr:hypothetical protein [Acidimicrobiales bacterium]